MMQEESEIRIWRNDNRFRSRSQVGFYWNLIILLKCYKFSAVAAHKSSLLVTQVPDKIPGRLGNFKFLSETGIKRKCKAEAES